MVCPHLSLSKKWRLWVPVSRTVTKYFTCAADFNSRRGISYYPHFMDEQTDIQKGEMNAQGQGQDVP